MFVIGLAVFIAGFVFSGIMVGFQSSYLIMSPAQIWGIVVSVVGVLAITSGFGLFVRCLNAAVFRKYWISAEDREKGAELFGLLAKIVPLAAILAALLRVVANFAYFTSDIELLGHVAEATAAGLAWAIIPPLFVFLPVAYALKHRPEAGAMSVKTYPRELGDRLLDLCYQKGLSAEDIERATDIDLHTE
ncbi:MAG: hypothetical protein LBS32_00605 [Clostridiales Family XIII bacterium]|nr:hypothetical protein [Clostridiales Family XIII bacterium]